jgi:hypothetical protein
MLTLWLKSFLAAAAFAVLSVSPSAAAELEATAEAPAAAKWPAIQPSTKPWVYWYWLGGIVDEVGLTKHLEDYQKAGLGGVHIVPIYGVRGYESRNVDFLSPRWMELLAHTTREADRLGMEVDMTCGTGWPFGGPWMQPPFSATQYSLKEIPLDKSLQAAGPVRAEPARDDSRLETIVAYGPDDDILELTNKVDSNGKLNWTAPSADWRLVALFRAPTNLPVERAAPGGEGPTIDFFSRESLDHYLKKFDEALALVPGLHLRALYSDSYENWGENWTPRLFQEFERRRGYDLKRHLSQLNSTDRSDEAARIRADYRETLADLIHENFAAHWVDWAHGKKVVTRNQAHGSPGNPLDLYALADIPETEVYGTSWLKLLGLKPLPGVPGASAGAPEVLFCKLAPSAAHVAGRKLSASETCTWLGDHFKIPLEHMKCQADLLFIMGTNHILFHGAAYSPHEAPWPGWLWYASTNIGPYLPAWDHIPALFEYITRCQSCLQSGEPDNDVLVYLPMYDLWSTDDGARDGMQHPTADDTTDWMGKVMPGFTAVGHMLWDRGFGFDLVSDRQIVGLSVETNEILSPGGRYRALIVPECRKMPHATLQNIERLVASGAIVVVQNQLPDDVPGLGDLESRREMLRASARRLGEHQSGKSGEKAIGSGRLLVGADVEQLLAEAKISRESMVDLGLEFIRRRDNDERLYFIVNNSEKEIDAWVPLSVSSQHIELLDPATAKIGKAAVRHLDDSSEIYLQLQPRQTVIVRALSMLRECPKWVYHRDGQAFPVDGQWNVEFVKGGPTLPKAQHVRELSDWTSWKNDSVAMESFSGLASYRIKFRKPEANAAAWSLDLGEVCHSARVRLNGKDLGDVIASPYRLDATEALIPGENELEIEVANLPANRVAELDRRGVDWKTFFFVDIHYHPFDASQWSPVVSGLIGPVRLIPQDTLNDEELVATQ